MLKRLYVDNFRCLVNFEIKFDRLNLLLGENGSGKTAVFDVLRRLQVFLCRATGPGVFEAKNITRWQTRKEQRFELETEFENKTYVYKLSVGHSSHGMRVESEDLSVDGQGVLAVEGENVIHGGRSYANSNPIRGLGSILVFPGVGEKSPAAPVFVRQLARTLIVELNPWAMETISAQGQPTPDQFVSFYRNALHSNQSVSPEFRQQLEGAIPNLSELDIPDADQTAKGLRVGLRSGTGSFDYTFDELSPGQKVLIALYFFVYGLKGGGYSLFLDEPENFLALREIQPWLAALEQEVGDGLEQAVLISHHPEIIDYLGAAAGRWFSRPRGGPARVSPVAPETGGLLLSETVARGWQ